MTRLVMTLALAALVGNARQPAQTADEWRAFAGVWSATGRRHAVATEGSRPAALVQLSGAVAVTSGGGLSRGFSGEAIGFDDGFGAVVGRAVWTGADGSQVFSVLKGEPFGGGRRLTGAITGGTGRFAGASGEYSLTWQFVVQAGDETFQGRAVDLRGRIRVAGAKR